MADLLNLPRSQPQTWRADVLLRAQNDALEQALSGAPLSDILNHLARTTAEQSGGQAAIFLVDEAGASLRFSASSGLPETYTQAVDGFVIGPDSPSCGNAAYTGERVIVGNVSADPLWLPFLGLAEEHGIEACWSTPIKSFEGEILGTLAIYHSAPCLPEDQDLEGVDLLAKTASILVGRERSEKGRQAALEFAQANEVAAREMSHRVMNSFQVLQGLVEMQAQGSSVVEVRAALGVLSGRLQAMSGMHRLLLKGVRENVDTVDLSEYLTQLLGTVSSAFISDDKFDLAVDVDKAALLPADQISPVGLIATELVLNALKHACVDGRQCRIEVSLRRRPGFYSLSIADNGKGLPAGAEQAGKSGLGMRLLKSLAKQLDATVEVDRTPPGVRFTITFPAISLTRTKSLN
jgi:two-component sensor histidine kinase